MCKSVHVRGWIWMVGCVLWVWWCLLVEVALCKEEEEEVYHPEAFVKFEKESQDLGALNAKDAADHVLSQIQKSLKHRIHGMFSKSAHSTSCRAKVGQEFAYFLNDDAPPYDTVAIPNECPEDVIDWDNLPRNTSIAALQFRRYQPPKNESDYITDPAELSFCFGILTHEAPHSTIRLIEALYQPTHVFVIHVDAKPSSDSTYQALLNYAHDKDYIHLVPHPHRVRVNWGGFSMVNATMQLLRYSFGLLLPEQTPLSFHKFIHLASTSYPIASNTRIRETIASYPLDANFFNVIMKPTRPSLGAWHYFIECDDALQRIYRLRPLSSSTHNHQNTLELYTSSQWFILSREFAQYLAIAEPGSVAHQMLLYSQHTVVADETFFGSVLRHSKFCDKHHNTNLLHLEFDSWENEMEVRDERKCVMPEKDRCGRSPTTLTMDYLPVLELSTDLFARKFSDEVPSQIKDVLDEKRKQEDEYLQNKNDQEITSYQFDPSFEGHGILIVAKETLNDTTPLCMGLGPQKNKLKLIPCFHDWVPPTLASGWESGAVIEEETLPHNRWELGPCSTDGNLTRANNGEMEVTIGKYSMTGPRCMLRQRDGPRRNRCLDVESYRIDPGGELQVYPCFRKWHQFVSFGNGIDTPASSMYFSIPSYMLNRKHKKHASSTKETNEPPKPQLCMGVYGRNNHINKTDSLQLNKKYNKTEFYPDDEDESTVGLLPLSKWREKRLLSVSCTKDDPSVIEWLVIPYIVEEDEEEHEDQNQEVLDKSTNDNNKIQGDGNPNMEKADRAQVNMDTEDQGSEDGKGEDQEGEEF